MHPGETSYEYLFQAGIQKSLPDFYADNDNNPVYKDGWKGMSLSFLWADSSGNIGAQLIAPVP